jgi:hypothetical protein
MSVEQVAVLAGVSVRTVYRWLASGKLRSLAAQDVRLLLLPMFAQEYRRGRRRAFARGRPFRFGADPRRHPLAAT